MPKRYETGFIKYITDQELASIIDYFSYSPSIQLAFKIMAYMGLRVGEVCPLRYDSIIFDQGKPVRIRLKLEKSERICERIIPDKIKPDLEYFLLIRKHIGRGIYILEPLNRSNSKNWHITPATLRWALLKCTRDLKLDDIYYLRKGKNKALHRISCHTFRHYFISRFYELSQHDLIGTQRVIGHANSETTARYIRSPLQLEARIINLI